MTTTIALFHPHRDSSRFNAHLAAAVKELPGVTVRDMYALYPDGVIDVAAEQAVLAEADRIILQFPMYWYSSPALLKQWEDDVFTYGWAYGSTGTALHGKELGLAVSAGASGYTHDGVGFTLPELLRPFEATSNLIGTRFLTPFTTEGTLAMSDNDIVARAEAYKEYVAGAHRD
ncbi:NAD(P)H-dependent oxidoreductase [Arcanobacterium haemolyticum]|nr:NAD(P)H-dependent oxidoreductase [Arcanobacterium haemolyticum]